MPHRSNQAVASQDQAEPQPHGDLPPRRRRWLVGWLTALTALAASFVVIGAGLWFTRLSIAELLIGAALAERGADADFRVTTLDLRRAVVSDLRIGDEREPDAAISAIEARWGWRGLFPYLESVHLTRPQLRLRINEQGQVSAGALEQLRGRPSARRASVPELQLEIEDGAVILQTPLGEIQAPIRASGTLGRDFSASARIEPVTRRDGAYALDNAGAELLIVSRDRNIAFRLTAQARHFVWPGAQADAAAIQAMGRAPLDLARYDVELAWRFAALRAPRFSATNAGGAIGGEGIARADSLSAEMWQAEARAHAAQVTLADNRFARPRFDGRLEGRDDRGRGDWTLSAEAFAGLALTSQQPSAAGVVTLNMSNGIDLSSTANLTLAHARLDDVAQARIRRAFPNLPQAPVGPTFTQAENALDRAADRFDLTAPLQVHVTNGQARLSVSQPIEARASSGLNLRLSPLRQGTPSLTLEWPALALSGAVDLTMSGGGAPNATLLVDTLTWTPQAPFIADGSLSLSNWRAGRAQIAAEELGLNLNIAQNGDGVLELVGPANITGPLGDGEVRDLNANLNLAITWGDGWRVAPREGCVPMQLGGLDAAGLSFANGRFALCALEGALVSANVQGRLSGGFVIQTLSLNGHLSGPDSHPARVGAQRVVGRFGGVEGDIRLAITADAPNVRIEMAEDRDLNLTLRELTANARIANSWSIEGAFRAGRLNDPSLPGAVSAIVGRWSAAPQDGKPVIRVEAGEALLEANEPASDDQLPLFHTLRLADVDATLRDGRLTANGAIRLESDGQGVARFAATHRMSEGEGRAEIRGVEIMFDERLQPYHFTELARGLVDLVRGPASADADIAWARDTLTATGRLRLQGLSLATSTIPVVRDVRGDIYFDDLFALTTPPGQLVTVGELSPGVTVHNGRVGFQLLPDGHVRIEQADFDFAGGVLSMQPTEITLGADETEFVLTLRDVDAAGLIEDLKIPNVAATGRIEGTFPLRLTRRSAYITDGVLRAQRGGGTLSYLGEIGEDASGPARVAFDALRNFDYDALSLTLDGDLNGEVVSSIQFSGENSGEPVDLGPIAPIPGIGSVHVRGVPFRFNVRVTAPFRRLAETAATITDPGSLLERGRRVEEPSEEVDPEPAPTR